ncbi:MAG: copper oxidase [Methylococcaceae bacterium]|nr:MAG: copper oxidase [Methylococcaceae bacterium]
MVLFVVSHYHLLLFATPVRFSLSTFDPPFRFLPRPALLLGAFILLSFAPPSRAELRTYYIAAEEVLWDYAPSYPVDPMHGTEFGDKEKVFLEGNEKDRIGHRYYKTHFVEYTDAAFATPKPRGPEWLHLGLLGPVIRGSVGDTIKVVLKNKTDNLPVSLHPHGLFYRKNSEGTHYNDGTLGADKADDHVAPGQIYTYTWEVPERAGPAPEDQSSIVWLYHSHVDETADTNTGLVGPIIISRKGELDAKGKLRGIDREFVVLFSVFDENKSLLLEKNMEEFAPRIDPDDAEFQESNRMHAMNGYVYGNLPGLTMREGEKVRWYQLALGTEVDLHTPHWHGNTLTSDGHRIDVLNLLPATHATVDMTPDNPGVWMYHCHVNDHIEAGMMAAYTVLPKSDKVAAKGKTGKQ